MIQLRDWEASSELPRVCMVCGKSARSDIVRRFAWHPQWIIVLILAGLLIYVIVALVLTKRMRVDVPVCEDHRGYWWKRNLIMWTPILVILAVGLVLMFVILEDRRGSNPVLGGLCVGIVLLFLGSLVLALVIQDRMIRPREITDRTITLVGVARRFESALEELRYQRRREREEGRHFGKPPPLPPPLPPDAFFREDRPSRREPGDPGWFKDDSR